MTGETAPSGSPNEAPRNVSGTTAPRPARVGLVGALIGLGVLTSALAVLDADRQVARVLGPAFALGGLVVGRLRDGRWTSLPLASLALVLALGSAGRADFRRADFQGYYGYLPSLTFDHDLRFRGAVERWDWPVRPPTPTGHRPTYQTPGPALLWSPFFLLAHVYVVLGRALRFSTYAPDGFSTPYLHSAMAGTIAVAVAGAWAIFAVLSRRLPRPIPALAVVGAVTTSPILFYLFRQPGMAHGLVFGLAGLALWVADRAEVQPSGKAYLAIGLVVGLLTLVRLQALVVALLFLPLILRDLRRRALRPSWLLLGAAAAFAAFFPQMVCWKIIYGQWLTLGGNLSQWAGDQKVAIPILHDPSSWLDFRSLNFWDVLLSADRGFFNWTPAMFLGVAGLFWALPQFRLLALGGVLVFLATAWFNGSFADVTGGDSFGARRFDVVVPFVALGFGVLLDTCRRRPLFAPILGLALLTLWNVNLIRLFEANLLQGAAPLERVAALQVKEIRRPVEEAFFELGGPPGRAFAYRFFVGEYFYFNIENRGIIDLADRNSSFLAGGWSGPMNRSGAPLFRIALSPKSCVQVPLMVAVGLRTTITARTAGPIENQTMRVSLNERASEPQPLGQPWSETVFTLPPEAAVPGQNRLCLEFTESRSKGGEGYQMAAQVRRIRIESLSPTWPTPAWGLYHKDP